MELNYIIFGTVWPAAREKPPAEFSRAAKPRMTATTAENYLYFAG
jgi:hypothetical protein